VWCLPAKDERREFYDAQERVLIIQLQSNLDNPTFASPTRSVVRHVRQSDTFGSPTRSAVRHVRQSDTFGSPTRSAVRHVRQSDTFGSPTRSVVRSGHCSTVQVYSFLCFMLQREPPTPPKPREDLMKCLMEADLMPT
ncbi:hypothetical protein J6590_101687, partial [Homalodisca vitripennis]